MFFNLPQLGETVSYEGFTGKVVALSLTDVKSSTSDTKMVVVTLAKGGKHETFHIGIPSVEPRVDNEVYKSVAQVLSAIQHHKEGSYGSSWKGKGEYRGIMANIDRKYDRLDKMTDDEVLGKTPSLAVLESYLANGGNGTTLENGSIQNSIAVTESKVDAIADLANYAILYMTYIKVNYPHLYKHWMEHNLPEYLSDHYTPSGYPIK